MKKIISLVVFCIWITSCLVQTEEQGVIDVLGEASEPCLCDSANPGSSVDISAAKALFISKVDPENFSTFNEITNQLGKDSLDELEKEFSFTKLMKYMLPSDGSVNYNQFVRSYLDGYLSVPSNLFESGELNDVRSRSVSRNKIFNEWSPVGTQADKVLTADSSLYKLLAVLFRPDLIEKDASGNLLNAGEFRFIFHSQSTDPNKHSLQKNHVIFEYKLPLDAATVDGQNVGALTRNEWNKFIGKLQCLNGAEYTKHLIKIATRVTKAKFSGSWRNGSALGQLRINDFLAPHTQGDPQSAPWSMFEFRLASNGLLQRHRMPKTPKDNFANFNGAPPTVFSPTSDKILKDGLSFGSIGSVLAWMQTNFSNVLNPDSDYNLPPKLEAWQVDYGSKASWIKALETENIGPSSATDAQQSFVKNRFSLNSCNSCHGGHFSSQALLNPNLGDTASLLGIDEIDFADISQVVKFVHVDEKSQPSEFLVHDLRNRKEELEFQLSVGNCMEN